MDYNVFLHYIKFADQYKISKPNIYIFLKDCIFKRIYNASGNRFPNNEIQNMFNTFQAEKQQWKVNNMQKNEYQQYLEQIFKSVDFKTLDLMSNEILKVITENVGIFGAYDNLTAQRINYFKKKIQEFKSNQRPNTNLKSIFSIFQKDNTQVKPQPKTYVQNPVSHNHNHIQNPIPHNHIQNPVSHNHIQNPAPQTFVQNNNAKFDLPDILKSNIKKSRHDPEIERLNNLMKQMKLSSRIYITNVQPGQFYNPYIMPNYIPKGVVTNIRLPIRKQDPNYQHLKKIIEKELILANQELDYHKIDMARNHLERAAYYLKNVID